MKTLQSYTALIEEEIQRINLPENPANLYEPLRYFMQLGGKRIRPVLTLLGAELFGAEGKSALPAAMAIEYFHNFSLIHDDIMDEAPLRRAQATIHTRWNTNIAILSGDVLLVKAYQELCKQEARHLPQLMEIYNRTAVEVCEGQQLDMDFEQRSTVSEADYIEMIRLKTSVLLGCALELGAIVADAPQKDQQLLYDFGVNTGIAFQIQDDVLDLYADPEKFGKQVGGDVLADKKTILQLHALQMANSIQGNAIAEAMKLTDASQKVSAITQVYNEIGVKNAVLELRDTYFTRAIAALEAIEVPVERKKMLLGVVDFLREREV